MNVKVNRGIAAIIFGLALGSVVNSAQPASGATHKTATANVAHFQGVQSMTGGIQEAVDSLPVTGGIVTIPPGSYLLRSYIRLRDNVSLIGSGASTLLKKDDDFRIPIVEDAKKGQKYIVVEDASSLAVGMGIMILDGKNNFWWSCYRITKIDGNKVFPEGAYSGRNKLAKDLLVSENARVQHQFPMICISGSKNNLIRDLTIDGNRSKQLPDSTGAGMGCGIFPMGDHSKVENCWICNMSRDGITYNTRVSGVVSNCIIHDNNRDGIHLGGGAEALITGNEIYNNGYAGIYFCSGNWHCRISNNLIHDNGKYGIGGIALPVSKKYQPDKIEEDWFSIISNNVIYRNREVGIHAHTSYGFVITGNIVKDNGAGICLYRAQRTIVSNNHCFDHRGYYGGVTTQSWGIIVRGSENVISNNICAGNRLGGIEWSGENNEIHGNVGKVVKIEFR